MALAPRDQDGSRETKRTLATVLKGVIDSTSCLVQCGHAGAAPSPLIR